MTPSNLRNNSPITLAGAIARQGYCLKIEIRDQRSHSSGNDVVLHRVQRSCCRIERVGGSGNASRILIEQKCAGL